MQSSEILLLVYSSLLLSSSLCQIPIDKLSNVGVIINEGKLLKIAGSYESRYIVLSLVPSIDLQDGCGTTQIIQYKNLLNRLLIPLKDALDLQESLITITNDTTVTNDNPQTRFFGAVIGTIALGVATAAQITAGIALAEAREARKDIALIKDSIVKTHNSVEFIQRGIGEQIIALKTLQDFVNDEIRPAIGELRCETTALKLGIKLTQHYSELATAFSSNLGTIGEKSLTLQALSSLYSANITEILSTIKKDKSDIYDIIYTEQVKGTVIDVDLEKYMVTLLVKIPILSEIPGVLIYRASSISYNIEGEEWHVAIPNYIINKASSLGGADVTNCIESKLAYICPRDPTQLIPDNQQKCILGDVSKCPVTKVINNLVPKFAFINGGVVANCIASTCTCGTNRIPVNQDRSKGVTFLTYTNCGLIGINGIELYANKRGRDTTWGNQIIKVGPAVSIRPVDISLNLASATNFLEESKTELMKARAIISAVGGWHNKESTQIIIIIIVCILIIIICGILYYLYRVRRLLIMINSTNNSPINAYTLESRMKNPYMGNHSN
uniref:Fusion glycoprotein F0 n=1 Tax=Human respirovirus 1 TaxID=12730 RepID=A0A059QAB1_9MONO|nr:fusion glycoprotein F0 [Human respirovirus 1]